MGARSRYVRRAWIAVRAGRAVEEQQPVAVVDLVLQRPRLERLGLERDLLAGAGQLAAYDDPARRASRRR